MKTLGITLSLLIGLDVMFLMLWIISGQVPVDSFYLGFVSNSILGILL